MWIRVGASILMSFGNFYFSCLFTKAVREHMEGYEVR